MVTGEQDGELALDKAERALLALLPDADALGLRSLMELGRRRGSVTRTEVSAALQTDRVPPDNLEEMLVMLSAFGVEVADEDEGDDQDAEKEPDAATADVRGTKGAEEDVASTADTIRMY